MEVVVVEQVEEVASSPKRARPESDVVGVGGDDYALGQVLEESDVVVAPPSKKLCIEEATLPAIIANVLELEDLELRADENITCSAPEISCDVNSGADVGYGAAEGESADLLTEHVVHSLFRDEQQELVATSECSTLDKEDAARVLRSLEEELGVSSESDDYASCVSSMPSSAAQEALVDAALSSWGEEIWNSNHDAFVSNGDVSDLAGGCSSGSSLTGENGGSAICSSQDFDNLCALGTFEAHVDGAQVDIGFLNEASDDELGIPPSPNSGRAFFDDEENKVEVCVSALSEAGAVVTGEHSAVDDGCADQSHVHEAVSRALQENFAESSTAFDVMSAEDSDWLMPVGSLDFLLDFSTGYVPVAT